MDTSGVVEFNRFSNVGAFYEIAVKAKEDYDRLQIEIERLRNSTMELSESEVSDAITEINEVERVIEKEIIKITIFLATFLESYIWEFASKELGDNYVKQHLDKLGIISKWEVILRLVTGDSLKLSDQDLGAFRNLIKFRNKIIHHKSEDTDKVVKKLRKDIESVKTLYQEVDVNLFFEMINSLFKELNRLDEKGHHYFKLRTFEERGKSNVETFLLKYKKLTP